MSAVGVSEARGVQTAPRSSVSQSSASEIPLHPLRNYEPANVLTPTQITPPSETAPVSTATPASSNTVASTSAKNVTKKDYLKEPRKHVTKSPDELKLTLLGRNALFAAPYERSGVVIDRPARLADWALPGPLKFGSFQWIYIAGAQSVGAALISGAINFGVAVALYKNQPSINIWTFNRQTVAGDMGVTLIIQQIVSFIITSSLVHRDLDIGPICPLRRPWPPLLHLPSTPASNGKFLGLRMAEPDAKLGRSEGQSKLKLLWWWLVRAVMTGSERNDLLARGISWRQRFERLIWTAAQGFFLCCLTFWWYWPIAIAIVAPIYEHQELAGTYIPMIIKLLYGAIMSLLTNPIMALMAMGAESSVRRCYPELDIWTPFGGREDVVRWQIEHGVTGTIPSADVEKQQ